ncbi:MAG: hypothetical protein HY823_05760 [Acidobacteria bacterium]|nr:hypothetical protein [Acidobacteriota bacterium]
MSARPSSMTLQGILLAALALLASACGGGGSGGGGGTPPPTIASFSAAPASISAGQSSTLSWSVSGATGLNVAPGPGSVSGTSVSVSPGATTAYTLTASNAGGSASATTTVTVVPLPVIASFAANPATISSGQTSTLSWSVTGAATLSLDRGIGTVTGTSRVVSPTSTTTYTLTAANSLGASVTATTTVTVSSPTANFGNAPDGTPTGYPTVFGIINPAQTGSFPTKLANNGARTLSIADGILGTQAKQTADAAIGDFSDVDGLQDMTVVLTSIPPPAAMAVKVTAPTGGSGGTMYLNVLFDRNMNGNWNDADEWVVKNHPVNLPAPGTSATVTPPAFPFSTGAVLPDPAWMRVALTREQIQGGTWNGTGSFSSGEVEDWLVNLAALPGNPPKRVPILTVEPGGPYKFPNGVGNKNIQFTVTNWAVPQGTFNYTLVHTGLGAVALGAWNKVPPVPIGSFMAPLGAPNPQVVAGVANSPGPAALPDQWRVTVEAIDPPALFVPGGVFIGVGAASALMDFQSEAGPAHTLSVFSANITHTRGVSPCPQPFSGAPYFPIKLTNTGGVALTWSVSSLPGWLTFSGAATSGTLAPGASASLPLAFTCSGYVVGSNKHTIVFTVTQSGTSTPSEGQTDIAIEVVVI